jgi:cell division septation protein DedD
LATHVQDDGFHEIQLNGKQLVFLFMAATVVSVVIFLCGVLVGRGVRAERAAIASAEATSLGGLSAVAEAAPQQALPTAVPPAAGLDPTSAAPPPAVDDLSYTDRLEKPSQPAEVLKPAAKAPAAPARTNQAPQPTARKEPEPPPAASAQAPVASAPPTGSGFALQVAALRERDEAEAIARRLKSKGYEAYVVTPSQGTPSVYRVRIGKFPTKREAESVAARLQKEEQFTPWITR